MDLKILEIASHTENKKALSNPTHSSKNKNPICGDEMEISLIVKKDIIEDMAYHCKSCVYCQASVSLLSRTIKHKNIQETLKWIHPNEFLSNEDLEILCSRLFNIKYYELGKIGRLIINKRLNLNININIGLML